MKPIIKKIRQEYEKYEDTLVAEIPRLSDLDLTKQIDIELLENLSTIVANMLQGNPKPLTLPVIVLVRDLINMTNKQIPIEIME